MHVMPGDQGRGTLYNVVDETVGPGQPRLCRVLGPRVPLGLMAFTVIERV